MNRLRLDRDTESSHFLICGDSGAGKSQVIRQLLHYARACDDAAVVLDSKLEFIQEYYRPEEGDRILSPKDDRTPYCHLGEEVIDEADAISVMRAFYPSHPDHPESRFFDDHANRIGAWLVTHSAPRPDYEEFGKWLTNPEEYIYPRLKGTEHEITLDDSAPSQRAGILSTMNEIGAAMRMMPGRDHRAKFTIREWSRDRKGWLFFPNTAATREALRPLQSAWCELAIRRIMSDAQQRRRVWIILDELDSLNALPVLADAVTQMRCTGNPMVLGIQNLAQLEDRYGKKSATIISQPFTKVILATSEAQSKKLLSDLIGEVLIRRFQLSSGEAGKGATGPEEFIRPLVMASEIGALKNLQGYLMQRGEVVKIQLPYVRPKHLQPAQIERILPPQCA